MTTLPGAGPTINGTAASETLVGTTADERILGRGGNDHIDGLAGADLIDGGAGNDWLIGSAGDDWLIGGQGNDVLTGSAGADQFRFDGLQITGAGTQDPGHDTDTIADLNFSEGDRVVLYNYFPGTFDDKDGIAESPTGNDLDITVPYTADPARYGEGAVLDSWADIVELEQFSHGHVATRQGEYVDDLLIEIYNLGGTIQTILVRGGWKNYVDAGGITVVGANHAPVLTADTSVHAMTEIAGVTAGSETDKATATLAFTDADLNDTHVVSSSLVASGWSNGTLPTDTAAALASALSLVSVDSVGSGAGSVRATFAIADKLTDFLAAGEKLTATYTVTVTDAAGSTSIQPVTFTITGTNDAPVIDLTHSSVRTLLTERATVTGSGTIQSVAGTVAFADTDLTDHPDASVTAQNVVYQDAKGMVSSLDAARIGMIKAAFGIAADAGNSHDGLINWTFKSPDNTFDFLGQGERLTLTSVILVDDHHGGQVSQDVTVTVIGTNDAPTSMADIAGVGQLTKLKVDAAHGLLANDRDADIHDTLVVTTVSDGCQTVCVSGSQVGTLRGDYGTLSLSSDGSYSYASDILGVLNQLKSGCLVPQDTFIYTASDGRGSTTTSTLTVTVATQGLQNYVQGTDGNDVLSASTCKTVLGKVLGINDAMVLDGGNGNDLLIGGNSKDVLIGGAGNDVLTGGGGRDTFVFGKSGGKDVITDFRAGFDDIQIDHTLLSSFAEVRGHSTQVGTSVVIDLGTDNSLTLQNILLKNLSAGDFYFA